MVLIEKARLVEATMASPPARIDVLVVEGTNLGTDKPVMSEVELENAFVALARETPRHVFVQWPARATSPQGPLQQQASAASRFSSGSCADRNERG